MTKEEVDQVHIEHRGATKYWNITMFAGPRPGNSGKVPCYADLVAMAEDILRTAKDLGMEWYTRNAEVMAWSSRDDRGIHTPDRFRVTLDMVTKDMEDSSGQDAWPGVSHP